MKRIFKDLITCGGKYKPCHSDYNRVRLLNGLVLIAIPVFTYFIIYDLYSGLVQYLLFDLFVVFWLAVLFVYMRRRGRISLIASLIAGTAAVVFLFFFITEDVDATGILGVLIYPLFAYFLLKAKVARVWIGVYLSIVLLLIGLSIAKVNPLPYTDNMLISLVITIGISFFVIDMYETSRESVRRGLNNQKELVAKVISSLPGVFFAMRNDGTPVLWNENLEEVSGYSKSEIRGGNVGGLFAANDWKKLQNLIQKWDKKDVLPVELTMSTKEKTLVPLYFTFRTAFENEKELIVGEGTDLTQLKEYQGQVRQLNDLQDHLVEVSIMRIRPVFQKICSRLDKLILGEVGEITDEQRNYLVETREGDCQVLDVFNNLIIHMELLEGTQTLSLEETDMSVLAGSIVSLEEGAAIEKGVTLRFSSPDERVPLIEVDPAKISYVVESFVDNAIRFTGSGGEINAELRVEENNIVFEIEDNGIGIPQTEQEKLFEPFFKGDHKGGDVHEGLGLGLSISKRYIEMHNGEVGFVSTEGGGSSFWFKLPIRLIPA